MSAHDVPASSRVLLVGNRSPITEVELARRLHAAGVDLEFIAHPDSPGLAALAAAGVPVTPLVLGGRLDPRAVRALRAKLIAGRFRILHALGNRPLTNGMAAALFLPVKLIAYRGTVGHVSRWDPSTWLKWLNPRIDRIVCVSDAVKDGLQYVGVRRDKLVTIYKGHDCVWYEDLTPPSRAALGVPEDAFLLGCVANMRPIKGVDVLLRALLLMPGELNVHLVLVGEVRDPAIAVLAKDARLQGRVHFLGYRTDAAAIAGAFDVAVMPSRGREGLPRAVIESMAQGVPAVVSAAGGLPELVVNGESGYVVPVDQPAALAEALLTLGRDPDLRHRMGAAARARIIDAFSIDTTVTKTHALYRELTT